MCRSDNVQTASSQVLRQLLCEIHRAVLAARAAERNHHAGEAAPLVAATLTSTSAIACERNSPTLGSRLQILDHRCIFPGERAESFFAPGIWQSARIEHESAAVARFVPRRGAMK